MHYVPNTTPGYAPDVFGAGKHGYRDGNPATGTAATNVLALQMNDVLGNLMRLCEWFGVATVAGNYDNVKDAVAAAVAAGAWAMAAVSKTANYTALAADRGKLIVYDTTGGARVLSYDPAANLGANWVGAVHNAGPNQVTLDPNGAETIDGASTLVLLAGESAIVQCNGTAFRTLARSRVPTAPPYASAAEQKTGTEAAKATAPATQHAHQSAAKAWVEFNGTGTIAVRKSYNVSSVTDLGLGKYRVNFTVPFTTVGYAVACSVESASSPTPLHSTIDAGGKAVGSVDVYVHDFSGALTDSPAVSVMCFGEQI